MLVRVEQLLHLEVGSRMDGVQQGPFVVERIVLTVQFAVDGAKRFHHDLLSDGLFACGVVAQLIASRCAHFAFGNIGLRVAYEHDGEHVDLFGIQSSQCGQCQLLFGPASLSDEAYWCAGTPFLQEQLLQSVELPVASLRLGIVDRRDEIADGSRLDAPLNALPGCHEVGE